MEQLGFQLELERMDRLDQISRLVEASHLVYLQTEESPNKLDEKQKLQGYIKEYLSLVPHENKYVFKETAHIMSRSATSSSDFSGYRACSGWSAISLYASNLLAQPWRKEYRTLRTYSGYYKHEVEANLVGAELMFELMGYKHNGFGIMTLEGPIDPDKVTNVSRDAIVAFVECQIMIQIWENISERNPISWVEVLEYRKQYTGAPEQTIRALNHQFLEKLKRNQVDNYRDFSYLPSPMMIPPSPMVTHPILADNYKPRFIPGNYHYVPPYETPLNYQYQQQLMHPNYAWNNRIGSAYNRIPQFDYLMNNCPSIYGSKTPTERLIEVDSPIPNYDKTRSHRRSNKHLDQNDFPKHFEDDYGRMERKNLIKTSTSLDSAPENWDYVYNTLESYKDTDHDDVLRKSKGSSFSNDVQGKFLKEKKKEIPLVDKKSIDLVDFNPQIDDQLNNHEQTVDMVPNFPVKSKNYMKSNSWNCSTCTFLNPSDVKICEMCNKSREKGNEDRPLASGGKECPQCTLVNERDALKCEACTHDLLNSPTYI